MNRIFSFRLPDKLWKAGLILFFILLLAAGVVLHDDYGGFTDEMLHIQTAAIQYKLILSKFMPAEQIPDIPIFGLDSLPALEGYINQYYGEAVMLPTLFISAIPGIGMDTASFLNFRRFYTFLNFWLALICFYKLIQYRFSNRLLAFTGTLMLLLTPRFFAESFYNCKDIVFFSWFLISLCAIAGYYFTSSTKSLILFGFAAALTVNTRIYGLVLYGMLICLVSLSALLRHETLSKNLRKPALTIFLSLGFYWLITPFLWQNPIQNFLAGITFAADQVGIDPLAVSSGKSLIRLGDAELFMGQLVSPKNVWYYIPVWMGITIPIVYCFLFLAGIIVLISSFFRKRKNSLDWQPLVFDGAMLLTLITIFGMIVLSKATLYHGWRHVYFLYVFFLYLSVFGLNAIFQHKFASNSVTVLKNLMISVMVVFSFSTTGIWMIRNHPLDFVYFNEIGRNYADQFSRDYWGVASKSCVLDLLNEYDGRRISLDLNADLTWGSINFSLLRLPLEQQAKFDPVWKTENAEYACFSYKNTPGNGYILPDFEPIQVYQVDGYDVATVFKRVTNFKYK